MLQQLSPKKYIETKARSLPVYKCLVNKDWEESKMADVIVMRKHSNGHITAGVYLVDLLCMGVKDTFYFFNEPEQDLENRFGVEYYQIFKEIDYNLAHNIIYSGHDFAMDFDIHPHRDFTITQYILEEDTEEIPLIDVAVGSEDGKPHLIVSHHNQFPDALAKLKRIAGEGNYHYTIGEELDEGYEYEKDEFNENEYDRNERGVRLDEISIGELNTINVQDVLLDDLMNPEKVSERTIFEQVIINAESLTSFLPDEITDLRPDEESRWELIWNEILDQAEFPSGMDQGIMDDFYKATDELLEIEEHMEDKEFSEEAFSNYLMKVLDTYSSNPMVVASMYETSTASHLEGVAEKAKIYVNGLQQQYPYLQISLALCALLNGTHDLRFSNIYNAKKIKNALPWVKQFYSIEVINFWLIKLLLHLEEGNLKEAVQYYYLIRETQVNEWLLESVLMKYNDALLTYFKSVSLDTKQH